MQTIHLPLSGRVYVGIIGLVGLAVLATELPGAGSRNTFQFLGYFLMTIVAASFPITLPGSMGRFPLSVLFTLAAIIELSAAEAILMACAATCVESIRESRRWDSSQKVSTIFRVASTAMAVSLAAGLNEWCLQMGQRPGSIGPAMAIGLVLFVGMTLPVHLYQVLALGAPAKATWRQTQFLSLPYYAAGATAAGLLSAANRFLGWQTSLMVLPMICVLWQSYRLYLAQLGTEKKQAEDLATLHLRTIEALALAIEAKDQTTFSRLHRVRLFAIEIAKELGLEANEMEALRAASILHDVGKLAVPDHIVSKRGKLTKVEFEKVKIHPVVAANIVDQVPFPYPVAPIVRHHHEKWNGGGYPDGLKGEQIPFGARILAVADCLDALISDCGYRAPMTVENAMQKLIAESGVSFDPKVIAALQRKRAKLEQLARSQDVRHDGCSPEFLSTIAAARLEAQRLLELAQDLGNSLSLPEVFSVLSIRLRELMPYDSLAVYVNNGERLLPQHAEGLNRRLLASLEVPIGQGLSGWVAETQKPVMNGDPVVEIGPARELAMTTPLQSALMIPLDGSGSTVGVLALYRAGKNAFTQDQLRILLAIGPKLASAIDNALSYQRASDCASTDYLTGLPNARSLFLHLDNELARCRRTRDSLAVLVCDLDGFKQVNDRFGHLEGDKLLKAVASALKESCREYDYVARMGGDEFVVVLPGLEAAALETRIERLSRMVEIAGEEITGESNLVTLSVGRAYHPPTGADAEELLAAADRSMYEHKKNQKLMRAVSRPRGYVFDSRLTVVH